MRSFVPSRSLCGLVLCGLLLVPAHARADAFAPIPSSDPIYRQLGALTLLGEGKPTPADANLTRYEAALQVARVAAVVSSRPGALPRSGYRALRELSNSLKSELRQLGVDVADVQRLCARQLSALPAAPVSGLFSGPSRAGVPTLPLDANGALGANSVLDAGTSPALPFQQQSVLHLPLSGSVRFDAARSILARPFPDPADGNNPALPARPGTERIVGSDAAVSVDLTSWLRVRALASQRELGIGDVSPLLSAPLFQGATQAKGVGGGLDVSPLKGLRLSTDVEQLSTDTGQSGTRVGGGVGLSAWQNRFTLSARLSRLLPGDSTVLPATASELNLGIGLSQNLSLRFLYQSLFSSQSEASRMAGGLNFSF